MKKKADQKAAKKLPYTDLQLIEGLKRGDAGATRCFFYQLCGFTLADIQRSLFKGAVAYDDLVNELYIYLASNDWAKLDTFKALNGCSLKSWLVPLAWRLFIQQRRRLLGMESDDIDQAAPLCDDDMRMEMAMDIHATLARMPSQRYAELLRMLLIEGYTTEECALRLSTTVQNIYNLKHRAILQFIDTFQ